MSICWFVFGGNGANARLPRPRQRRFRQLTSAERGPRGSPGDGQSPRAGVSPADSFGPATEGPAVNINSNLNDISPGG